MPLTKRGLLSVISRVFDPIGILAPALLVPRMLMQKAWRFQIGWDEILPEELLQVFEKWSLSYDFLQHCSIPRWSHHGPSDMHCCELHVFSDGSGVAYSCSAYLRCSYGGQISIGFVAAKTRVAPSKAEPLTIPRLELLGALIATRLYKSLGLPEEVRTYFWSDSTVALAWITQPVIWKTWVGNRVGEIRQCTQPEQWGHVEGSKNPADLPSRGCDFETLIKSDWLKGPQWLLEEPCYWPCSPVTNRRSEEADREARTTFNNLVMIAVEKTNFSKEVLSYFSRYKKIWRMIAWILRFVFNRVISSFRNLEKRVGPLSVLEFEEAEEAMFRLIQRESNEEGNNLQLFEDSKGLLRVKTRLQLMDAEEGFKNPILLFDHPLVRLMIRDFHEENNHAGVSTILATLREKFWIIRGRKVIRLVVSRCVKCKRFNSKNIIPPIACLPKERVNKSPAFNVTGVDLAGPLYLNDGRKVWIVLFTCAVYRAVHLELVSALSTEAFMMALRRFINRRGRPSVMWSDQGSNFGGAVSDLNEIDWTRLVEECAIRKMDWRLNPPAAPWYGGWWERLVGVVKGCLRKTLGNASLTYEELLTVLIDCEGIVNKRPLTYVGEKDDELKPITPWDFLCENTSPVTLDIDEVDRTSLLSRITYVQKVREDLRNRFQSEYVGFLGAQSRKIRGEIKVGDVVLIGSDNKKRLMWPLGKVIKIFAGKDGGSRVVQLSVQGGNLIRPMQRIYPLEINFSEYSVDEDVRVPDVEKVEDISDMSITEQSVCNEAKPSVSTKSGRMIRKPKVFDL